MDADDIDYFETLPFEKLDEAERELRGLGDSTDPIAPDAAIGRLSRLDAMQMQEMALEQKRRLEDRIQQLKAARNRLETGNYGRCSHCGKPIEFDRLQARPEAELCAGCIERFGSGRAG